MLYARIGVDGEIEGFYEARHEIPVEEIAKHPDGGLVLRPVVDDANEIVPSGMRRAERKYKVKLSHVLRSWELEAIPPR